MVGSDATVAVMRRASSDGDLAIEESGQRRMISATIASCGTSRDCTVISASRIDRFALGQQLAQGRGRVGGLQQRPVVLALAIRRISTSSSAVSQIETPFALMAARVSAFITAPPPVASTCGPLSSRRAMTRASPLRKSASPWRAKISAMLMPAAFSISLSASTKGMPRRAPSRRPIDDLPTPIMPTSTIERRPARQDRGRGGGPSLPFCIVISVIYHSRSRPALRRRGLDPQAAPHESPGHLPVRAEHDRTRSRSPAPMG